MPSISSGDAISPETEDVTIISGVTFLEIIKGSKFAKTPIFLYSAEEDEKLVKDIVRKTNAKGYLPKNFTAKILLETVKDIEL